MSFSILAAATNMPEHCTPTSQYLGRFSSAFHSCVPTSLAFISTSLGVFSIISWLFAQIPQIYKNYKIQSASGLSIYFLAEWLLGDLTNLLGALLTKQATWQIVVAGYYVTVDVALVCQYFWYTHLKAWRKSRTMEDGGDSDRRLGSSREVLVGVSPSDGSDSLGTTGTGDGRDHTKAATIPSKPRKSQSRTPDLSSSYSSKEKGAPKIANRTIKRPQGSPTITPSLQMVLLVSILCVVLTNASPIGIQVTKSPPQPSASEFAGQIFSWCSTLLYLGSRLPQIYKNAIRRSTAGLSPTLFIAAFFGNLFYSTSLLTNPLAWASYPPYGLHGWVGPEGSDRKQWVELAAPFWLGAAGVLALDAAVGVQFLMFGEGKAVCVEDRKGRSRWRKVSGWMRGWVPSPSPGRRIKEANGNEEGRLLGRRDGEGGTYGTA